MEWGGLGCHEFEHGVVAAMAAIGGQERSSSLFKRLRRVLGEREGG